MLPEAASGDLVDRAGLLEDWLASVIAIEHAKGALMAIYGISADAASSMLRAHSQNRNVKVRHIAQQLANLMSNSARNTAAIARFDHLLDEIARNLQPSPIPPGPGHDIVSHQTGGEARGARRT